MYSKLALDYHILLIETTECEGSIVMPSLSGHEREQAHIQGLKAWMNGKHWDEAPSDDFDFTNYNPQVTIDRYKAEYQIKCRRRNKYTGYGLAGEPQWSEGPPPLIEYLSPYHGLPLPPTYDINPILARSESELIWSIHQPPYFAKPHPDSTTFNSYHWQSRPATTPSNVDAMFIHIRSLDCMIQVRARKEIITIGDVLHAIYNEARKITMQVRIMYMGADPGLLEAIGRYRPVVSTIPGPPMGDDALSGNVSELMNFRTDWLGLSPSRTHNNVWELYTYRY